MALLSKVREQNCQKKLVTDIVHFERSTDLETIVEINLTDNNDETTLSNASEVADETYLAAYYDSENSKRHVIYQKDADKVYDYNIDDDERKIPRSPIDIPSIFVH
jgi:hypothetical protein